MASLFTANTMTKARRNRACSADLAGWLMQWIVIELDCLGKMPRTVNSCKFTRHFIVDLMLRIATDMVSRVLVAHVALRTLRAGLPLLAGWWGQKQSTRFNMAHHWDPEADAFSGVSLIMSEVEDEYPKIIPDSLRCHQTWLGNST